MTSELRHWPSWCFALDLVQLFVDRETPSVAVTTAGMGRFVSGNPTYFQGPDLERTNSRQRSHLVWDNNGHNLSKVNYTILLLYGEARNHIFFALA